MDIDTYLAIATLYQEARGVSDNAAVLAVCHVIRNRMAARYFSDGTVAGTVLYPYQFSGWNPGSEVAGASLRSVPQEPRLLALWLSSQHEIDPTSGALLYYSPASMESRKRPAWAYRTAFCCSFGPFDFYKLKP